MWALLTVDETDKPCMFQRSCVVIGLQLSNVKIYVKTLYLLIADFFSLQRTIFLVSPLTMMVLLLFT